MPFDSKPESRLTLADLSWRLRNPDTWPAGFRWDYSDCNRCAMGLAWELSGGRWEPFSDVSSETAAKLAIAVLADVDAADCEPLRTAFLRLHIRKMTKAAAITPADVADAIDRHLAQKVSV